MPTGSGLLATGAQILFNVAVDTTVASATTATKVGVEVGGWVIGTAIKVGAPMAASGVYEAGKYVYNCFHSQPEETAKTQQMESEEQKEQEQNTAPSPTNA